VFNIKGFRISRNIKVFSQLLMSANRSKGHFFNNVSKNNFEPRTLNLEPIPLVESYVKTMTGPAQ